ncbi:MAG: hypothetical protein RL129_534 [Actinomycetota bacterium]|jgi:hypothetical protein
MKKVIITAICAVLISPALPTAPANAHVGVQLRGNSIVAGASSRIYLSLGHGCVSNNVQYGTRKFSVNVPAAAGKPTPEFHAGFKSEVIASKEVDANNAPTSYTVNWIAKSAANEVDPYSFYDFGFKVTWDKTPQKINFKTAQTCYVPETSKKLYLKWIITDGSTTPATDDTEFGPAPSVTTIAG